MPLLPLSCRSTFSLCCLTFVLTLNLGCGDKDKDQTQQKPPVDSGASKTPHGKEAQEGFSKAKGPRPKRAPTAKEVDLEISAVGGEQIPTSIAFQSKVPLAPGSYSTIDPTRTKVVVKPEVSGRLERTGPSSFLFRPDGPLAPQSSYTVSVESLEVQNNVLVPPTPWSQKFETPEFKALSMSSPVRTGPSTVSVTLNFSAPPRSADLRRFASWTYEGKAITSGATYALEPGSNVVNVTLTSPNFAQKAEGTVVFKLAKGLPYDDTIKAAAATFEAQVVEGPKVAILGVYKTETGSGFTIRVVCDDDSAPGSKRYYWDQNLEDSYQLKSSCMPDVRSAQNHIVVSPKVPFQVSSVGRGGFQLHGDFKRGAYNIQIRPGLMTDTGGVVRDHLETTVTIPAQSPMVRFASKGRYMPEEAWNSVALEHRNTEAIELTIRHIPQENVRFWMSGEDEMAGERVANVVFKTILKPKGTEDQKETLWLDLPTWIPSPKRGVYDIEARIGESRDISRLLLTDLNLIAKVAATPEEEHWSKSIWVWTLDLKTNAARPGTKVYAVRPSGMALGSCTTDDKGFCLITLPKEGIDEAKPYALIAEGPKSSTYLKYDELRTQLPMSEVALGQPYQNASPYHGVFYAERDLYRPGETAHFVALARRKDWGAASDQTPALLTIEDAQRRQVLKKLVRLNAAGMATLSYKLADFAPTGSWTLTMKIANKVVATYPFHVEEFVPERMRVTASFQKQGYVLSQGALPEVGIKARYLFGGSTEGAKVQVTCALTPARFTPPGYEDYTFGQEPGEKVAQRRTLATTEVTINAEDGASTDCIGQEEARSIRTSTRLQATVAVLEAGSGRATRAQASTLIHPMNAFVGLKTNTKHAKPGDTLSLEGVVVDQEGKPVVDGRTVELSLSRMEHEYGWYWDDEWDNERYEYHAHPVLEQTLSVKVDGQGKFKASLPIKTSSSNFLVAAALGEARSELRVSGGGYYSWHGDTSNQGVTPSPRAPASIPIAGPEAIDLGQRATVTFEAPFAGRALVTVETDEVLSHDWITMTPGENTWSFQIDRFVPNVYLSVLGVKDPQAESKKAFLPGRAMGAKSIKIRPSTMTQAVSLEVPKSIRSERTLKVKLSAPNPGEDAWATVAVVDEGILSLTRFETPSPLDTMLGKRALGVTTYDTIGWALVMEVMRAAFGGGDGDGDGVLRRPQVVKPVSLWSGKVKVPASGELDIPFKLPLYRGEVRVMAVVVSPTKMGKAEATVKVRDPLTVQTTLPRFLSHGDEMTVPVFVTNTSGKAQKVTVSVEVDDEGEGPAFASTQPAVSLLGETQKSVSLEDGASGKVLFKLRANRQSGLAKMTVLAASEKHKSRDEGLMLLLPSGPVEQDTQVLKITGGSDINLSAYLEGWVETSSRSTFWLSNNPYGRAFDHLGFLVRYPYGCIEQTTSSTRPLLFIGDILAMVAPGMAPRQKEIEEKVDHGIDRVLSMQTGDGGFAYWPGDTEPDPWGTAYAVHMLMDAKDQKFKVPQDRLDKAISWLSRNSDRQRYDYAEPYIHYVLARVGKARKGRIKQLVAAETTKPQKGQTKENIYLLKAALYLAGDRSHEADLKSYDLSPITEERHYDWTYYSDRRMRGLMLATAVDLFKKPEAKALADLVAKSLSQAKSSSYTTQEIMWGVTGLGKWLTTQSSGIKDVSLTLGGKEFEPVAKNSAGLSWSVVRASEYPSASIKIGGSASDDLYLMVSTTGVKQQPSVSAGGQGLSITRAYYSADGTKLYGSPVELGQVIYAKVSLKNTTREKIQNIALVERLGAGFEIENPNLGQGELPTENLSQGLWQVDHMNRRDDRVEAFGALKGGEEASIVVALRATSAGTFGVPAASAEAMYDPRKWSLTPRERLVIKGPWD